MLVNKVVARFLDGRTVKGTTQDFVPTKDSFHIADAGDAREVTEVFTKELKAVFFVKSFSGNPLREKTRSSGALEEAGGRKLKVTFSDGEVIHGTTNAYSPGRRTFVIVPADPEDNNERIYVFGHATEAVEVLQPVAVRR